jgi:hypothetical protein
MMSYEFCVTQAKFHSDLGSGVPFERRVRQANRAQKLGAFGKVAPDGRVGLVHRAFARDERDHASRTDFVQRLAEKIIMYQKTIFVEARIADM